MPKSLSRIVLVLFVLIITAFLLLVVILLKKNISFSNVPYFPKQNLQVSGTNIQLIEFQPFYLWSYKKDGALLMKVLYFDDKGKMRINNVFVGGMLNEKETNLAAYAKENGELINNKKLDEFTFPFKFGQRVRIRYISKVDKGELQSLGDICDQNKDFCTLAEYLAETAYDHTNLNTEKLKDTNEIIVTQGILEHLLVE